MHTWRSDLSLWANAVVSGPRYHGFYHNLGSALFDAGRHAESVSNFQASLSLHETPLVHMAAGNLALQRHQLDSEVVYHYDRALELGNHGLLDHHRAEIMHNLGVLYARGFSGAAPNWEGARKLFSEAAR